MQALSFYLLKLDPQEFSLTFDDEQLRHWLTANGQALTDTIKLAAIWQKAIAINPAIKDSTEPQTIAIIFKQAIENQIKNLSIAGQKHFAKVLGELSKMDEWNSLEESSTLLKKQALRTKVRAIDEIARGAQELVDKKDPEKGIKKTIIFSKADESTIEPLLEAIKSFFQSYPLNSPPCPQTETKLKKFLQYLKQHNRGSISLVTIMCIVSILTTAICARNILILTNYGQP